MTEEEKKSIQSLFEACRDGECSTKDAAEHLEDLLADADDKVGRGFDDEPSVLRGMRAKCEFCQHLYFQTEETTERHCEVCSKEDLPPGRIHGVRERRHQPPKQPLSSPDELIAEAASSTWANRSHVPPKFLRRCPGLNDSPQGHDKLVQTPEALRGLDDDRFPLSVTTKLAVDLLGAEFTLSDQAMLIQDAQRELKALSDVANIDSSTLNSPLAAHVVRAAIIANKEKVASHRCLDGSGGDDEPEEYFCEACDAMHPATRIHGVRERKRLPYEKPAVISAIKIPVRKDMGDEPFFGVGTNQVPEPAGDDVLYMIDGLQTRIVQDAEPLVVTLPDVLSGAVVTIQATYGPVEVAVASWSRFVLQPAEHVSLVGCFEHDWQRVEGDQIQCPKCLEDECLDDPQRITRSSEDHEGPKTFINRCLDCGHVQEAGPCAVCPHVPGLDGVQGHYARRPCKSCGSANLTSETQIEGAL